MESKQVKSKERVANHGEVFTNEREVNAMLDLVKQETERIDSRFLEPACGTGNFLTEILQRKLAVVKKRYGKNPPDYEKYAVVAVTSIYGVELLQDNVDECREAVKFILHRNILCGDALTMKNSAGQPIIFSEWSLVSGSKIKRRDFRLDQLLEGHDIQPTLLNEWEYDEEIKALIPKPIREFELIDYRKVQEQDYE